MDRGSGMTDVTQACTTTGLRSSEISVEVTYLSRRRYLVPGHAHCRDLATSIAPDSDNSVQWLAERIVADKRFAEATVKFWWPAIMGSEVAEPPEDEGDAGLRGAAARGQRTGRGGGRGLRQRVPAWLPR